MLRSSEPTSWWVRGSRLSCPSGFFTCTGHRDTEARRYQVLVLIVFCVSVTLWPVGSDGFGWQQNFEHGAVLVAGRDRAPVALHDCLHDR